MRRTYRLRLGAVAAVSSIVAYIVIAAVPASAVVSCAVTGTSPNQIMTVTMDGAGDTVTLIVSGANILVNAGACTPPATTADVSEIIVRAELLTEVEDQTVTIDGSGGDFTASITASLGAGDDTLTSASLLTSITVNSGPGNDTITTGAGNDTITSGAGNDTITAGAGNDTVTAETGNDTVTGDDGDDTMSGDNGDDTVSGSDGADTATGGAGLDTLSGGADRDVLSGDGDNDTLTGGDGADWLVPGEGDDGVDGQAQRDTVSFNDATAPVDANLTAGTATTGADVDVLVSIENAEGSDLVDTILGTSGNNQITGGKSADLVRSVGGKDTVRGGGGPDRLRGGRGDDGLFGQRGADALFGGRGVDVCKGGKGVDTIHGCE